MEAASSSRPVVAVVAVQNEIQNLDGTPRTRSAPPKNAKNKGYGTNKRASFSLHADDSSDGNTPRNFFS